MGTVSGLLTVNARLPSFIVSLAMMFIANGAAQYLTRGERYYPPELLKIVGNKGFAGGGLTLLPYNAILAGVVFLVAHLVLRHTRFGRYVYMTGGNREAARLAGVRTGWIIVACLAICALTAGLGGLVSAGRMGSITSKPNPDLLLSAVACVVLGGTSLFGGEGGIGRTLVGALTFTVLKLGLNQITWIDDMARQLLMGAVLMTALVINGVLAKRE
jgi:ribose transport system permease protein